MWFWLSSSVLTAVVALVLLNPLRSPRQTSTSPHENEAAVYRDQLKELDRDLNYGQISIDQAALAKAEIARRMLVISKIPVAEDYLEGPHYLCWLAILVSMPATTIALYLTLGSPELPEQPLAARLANPGNDLAIIIRKTETEPLGRGVEATEIFPDLGIGPAPPIVERLAAVRKGN